VLGNARYAAAIEVLIKSILLEPAALYRIPQWAQHFDAATIGLSNLNDDVIGRALDRLFRADRATIQTALTMRAVKAFQMDVSQIHNDSTTVRTIGRT
jgi:choline kinase